MCRFSAILLFIPVHPNSSPLIPVHTCLLLFAPVYSLIYPVYSRLVQAKSTVATATVFLNSRIQI